MYHLKRRVLNTTQSELHYCNDHTLQKHYGQAYSDFQCDFRSPWSIADLKVVSDRIAKAFGRSDATQSVAVDMPKAFDKVWHAGLLHKLKSFGISYHIFSLISSLLSNRRLWFVLGGKPSQRDPVNAGNPQGSILVPTLLLLCINDFRDDVCNIVIYADDTILHYKCDQESDLWQKQDTVN